MLQAIRQHSLERDGQRVPVDSASRPAWDDRAFASSAVDAFVADVAERVDDPHVARLFANCFPNTLDTTVRFEQDGGPGGGPDTFVITGDIPAMWLRDSAAQVWPYLALARDDAALTQMLAGLVSRQARCVLLDPYANAFEYDAESRDGHFGGDLTDMHPGVYERKWEVDSLSYFLRLSAGCWSAVGDAVAGVFDTTWLRAVARVIETFEVQRGSDAGEAYRFQRVTPHASDTLPVGGRGNPGRPCGLIRSGFRPSDDACLFPYLIPSNLMAAAELGRVAGLLETLPLDGAADVAARARGLSRAVRRAVAEHGIAHHPRHGSVFAYEVDGFGGVHLMDDANIPSLLALPYLGAIAADDELYVNTRRFVLSEDNPYYHKGEIAQGVGSPHTDYGSVWPMSLIAQGLTAATREEAWDAARRVAQLDGGTGFMHESIDPNDPSRYTRPWFAWVNGLFGELVCRAVGTPLYETRL